MIEKIEELTDEEETFLSQRSKYLKHIRKRNPFNEEWLFENDQGG